MLAAFPLAREKHNGWYEHVDNPRFDFRVQENGSIVIHSWTGRSAEDVLAMGGLKRSDISLKGTYPGPTRDSLDLLDLAIAKCIDPRFLTSLGLQSGYLFNSRHYVKVPYYLADGTEHSKMKVRCKVEGTGKHYWDTDTPGELIPYGLHKLDMARDAGYLLIGEGESDAWTCWYHNVPYLGIPGAGNKSCFKHIDIEALPSKIYILQEPDQAIKLLGSGTGFYKTAHSALRAAGYTGQIFCIDFEKATKQKDPSDLHIKLWPEKQAEQFKDRIQKAIQKAIPDGDVKDNAPIFTIQDERVLKAIVERNKQEIYALAPEITEMSDVEQDHIRLAIQDVFEKSFPMREFNGLLKSAKTENERKKQIEPVIFSVKELMKMKFAPVDYVVPGILPVGLIVLAGKQKIGKSWIDLNLALAVASGGIAFSKDKVKQGDVLYMALEDNQRRLQERIDILMAPGGELPDGLDIVTTWPRMDKDGIAKLEKWIVSHPNARLVIIDPWVMVKPVVKVMPGSTGYDAEYEAFKGIKALADKYEICILVQFHLRKAVAEDYVDTINATTGVTACADGFLVLQRLRGEEGASLRGTGRDFKEDVDLVMNFKGGIWSIPGDANPAYYRLGPERRAVIDLLCTAIQPSTPKDLAVLLSVPDGTMRKRLFDMKEDGQIEWREENGVSGYVSLISSPNVKNIDANLGNGGNASNEGNNGNGGNGLVTGSDQGESVTENKTPLPTVTDTKNAVDEPVAMDEGNIEGESVTAVTDVTMVIDNILAEEVVISPEDALPPMADTDIPDPVDCATKYDGCLCGDHEPATYEEGVVLDAMGNEWCSKCLAHCQLMILGEKLGYPELKNGKKAKDIFLRAGQASWLICATSWGDQYVAEALKIAIAQLM
jgi:hypothetical protein